MAKATPIIMDGSERFGSAAAAAIFLQLQGVPATEAGVRAAAAGERESHCGHTFERAGSARDGR